MVLRLHAYKTTFRRYGNARGSIYGYIAGAGEKEEEKEKEGEVRRKRYRRYRGREGGGIRANCPICAPQAASGLSRMNMSDK